jgi:HD-like signal output (HDOD) protein
MLLSVVFLESKRRVLNLAVSRHKQKQMQNSGTNDQIKFTWSQCRRRASASENIAKRGNQFSEKQQIIELTK